MLVARARSAHPGAELESIRYYGERTAPFLVYFTDRDYVHLNPYTGAVIGVRRRYGEGWGWIQGLHSFLAFEPSFGEPLMGYHALAFALLTLTGIVLWWPATRRALVAGLTLNRKLKGRPWNLNLHKVLGIYAAAVVLFSALSGMPVSLDWAKAALYPLTGTRRAETPALAQPAPGFVGFDAIAARLATLFPAASETYIPLPKDGRVAAYAIAADAPHPNARSYAWFNGGTGGLLRTAPYAQQNLGFRSYYYLLSLHTGVAGGAVWQVVQFLGALAVPILAYTGIASYLQRKANRKRAAHAAAARPAAAAGNPVPPPAAS